MNIEIRKLTLEDYSDLKESMEQAYDTLGGQIWSKQTIAKLLKLFPEGQLCIAVDEKVVACSLSIIVDYDEYGDKHTYQMITGRYTFSTHDPNGDTLYGIEIFVSPEYRGLRLGRRLYEARKELCESLNLKSIIAGGRIPGYHEHADTLSPRQYIDKVKAKELYDSTLTFQLSNDFHVRKVLKNYLPGDHESKEFATLIEWNNIYYQGVDASARSAKTIRIGLVQWQMRLFPTMDAFYEQVEFFVDAVSGYKSDFIMFPEFFNTPLLQPYNHLPEMEAMRKLAELTEEIVIKIQEYAVSYNVNIISGSMPILEDNKLYNATYLCHRNGKTDEYRKIHITPNERKYYGMVGGDKIQVFDTDCGKVGILVCYDVEFPELSRIYADQGMQILFVPFLTDTQNGYTRVRRCAQARAIENECYVAIAGCVGNLPKVNNMDIQFAQSAVFTPSDFAFPTNAVKAEATPNTEMMLVVDVDLHLLDEIHHFGTVRILKDRRNDLYEVKLLK
ncbi:bifunctional GNAT family N-acetyltransferase/carbon-nitrogen hydrolase family protein [Pedobacter panaciterrae]|jgi:predicted amidohydrolase/ribosomal protein S18 acetylase RimI-like enzyme|uniref:Bifunctional GNAT family N-acetyltransferase/carbon-nitrogen hydrolase family protein n=1 Tax=Pedobacter panaciterrae TaxID=363849 RepID=A0ABU8NT06_9SPHI|nr:bifunctional GNAT family N-acetyltransferase/carbon-nitrogen hydrolase family protein [Pedobacter panaciterrae]NQX55693.1 GNAT family N-acetyltransferase [Pedobacter panaciterrae]